MTLLQVYHGTLHREHEAPLEIAVKVIHPNVKVCGQILAHIAIMTSNIAGDDTPGLGHLLVCREHH